MFLPIDLSFVCVSSLIFVKNDYIKYDKHTLLSIFVLTFYVNIISAQRATFFTPGISNSFLSRFIAWLNLNQGFELCLYDGLDDYIVTWLEFLFPLYIWLIAAALIVSSHYSTRISKLTGNNAVQVLATLFLITYAKLLQLIINVFSFTWIPYPDGYDKRVWLIDGNIEFFKGKHVPLVVVTVIFILFTLPYTFILLTIQFLYKVSHYRTMFWVQRLKPFFDAYTGPYRANHRYWTGLLLITRIVLLLIFSSNSNTSVNLYAIFLTSFALLGWLTFAKLIYEYWVNNFLEIFFLSNLGITTAAILFDNLNGDYSVTISTSVTFIVFVCIILCHVYKQLLPTKFGSVLNKYTFSKCSLLLEQIKVHYDMKELEEPDPVSSGQNRSSSVVELKEPLLET